MKKLQTVDQYIEKHTQWQPQLKELRQALLATELEETLKWGAPVYCIKGKNVIGLGAFKQHIGVWFFNGALLSDPAHKLINAQEGKTQAMRQWRIEQDQDIDFEELNYYVREAIDNQLAGREVERKPQTEPEMPALLEHVLLTDKEFKAGFETLTPGKQREYIAHIAAAKRDATKQSRLIKIIPMVKQGIGLNDKYRSC